jgi:hypothetical protein
MSDPTLKMCMTLAQLALMKKELPGGPFMACEKAGDKFTFRGIEFEIVADEDRLEDAILVCYRPEDGHDILPDSVLKDCVVCGTSVYVHVPTVGNNHPPPHCSKCAFEAMKKAEAGDAGKSNPKDEGEDQPQ